MFHPANYINSKATTMYLLSQPFDFALKHHHPELNTSHTVKLQYYIIKDRKMNTFEIINHCMSYNSTIVRLKWLQPIGSIIN